VKKNFPVGEKEKKVPPVEQTLGPNSNDAKSKLPERRAPTKFEQVKSQNKSSKFFQFEKKHWVTF
jgi:hypothetical protein